MVTSRLPKDLPDFCKAIISKLRWMIDEVVSQSRHLWTQFRKLEGNYRVGIH
jgi:hypothetical protein